ncbi:MAG: hypothetical protein JO025_21055 [Verrucomicrobia bacterium]|jgi:hypothetical protein|nr:hypothetical protein [Verrucomicrobiota bacterium]
MRQILDTEQYVQVPPMMLSDPFYRITYLIKEEIRKYKWIEGEKGRKLTWEEARKEWMDKYRAKYEEFLLDTMTFPEAERK